MKRERSLIQLRLELASRHPVLQDSTTQTEVVRVLAQLLASALDPPVLETTEGSDESR